MRNIRGEVGLGPSEPLDIRIVSPSAEKARLLAECEHHFHQLVRVEKFGISEGEGDLGPHATAVIGDVKVHVLLSEELLAKERARLEKAFDKASKSVSGLEKKLSNEGFTSGAPAHVVEAERERLAKMQAELAELTGKRDRLG